MRTGRFLLLYGCFMLVANLAREPLFRPNESTVRLWLEGKTIRVERRVCSEPFGFELIEGTKIVGLKYVSGTVYRGFLGYNHANVTYTFEYPHGGVMQRYRTDIRYTAQCRLFGITRELMDVSAVGPL